ncbi:MAG TPA: galactose oxidase early set domain-containing protein [Candidatus Obscuribacterales bacterium]
MLKRCLLAGLALSCLLGLPALAQEFSAEILLRDLARPQNGPLEKLSPAGHVLAEGVTTGGQTRWIEMPAGGWWITPIHASLLPLDGRVLLSGWGRAGYRSCERSQPEAGLNPATRRYGVSFLIHPGRLLTLAKPTDSGLEYTINPLPGEHFSDRAFELQAHYCAGHVPLADGRLLFMGGSKYQQLGFGAAEEEFGLNYGRYFDPLTSSFELIPERTPDELKPPGAVENTLWYPTLTRLPDDRVLIIGGFYRAVKGEIGNRSLQIFDPEAQSCRWVCQAQDWLCQQRKADACQLLGQRPGRGWPVWLPLSAHTQTPADLQPGIRDYIHSFLLPRPVSVGVRQYPLLMQGYAGHWYLVSPEASLTPAERFVSLAQRPGPVPGAGPSESWSASSAQLYTGEILTLGGYSHPITAQRADLYDPYTRDPARAWRSIHTGVTRHSPATVLLPDGNLLIANGWSDSQPFERVDPSYREDLRARMQVQILDPDPRLGSDPAVASYDQIVVRPAAVKTFAPWSGPSGALRPDEQERGYHSLALLLKDGSVLLGGGTSRFGNVGCEQPSLRIFYPPYFHLPRPEISGGGLSLKIGGPPVRLSYSGPELRPGVSHPGAFERSGAVLMAPGAFTHGFNQSQRYIGLAYTQTRSATGGTLSLYPPASSTQALPGEYLLFLVSRQGAPSQSVYVKLTR